MTTASDYLHVKHLIHAIEPRWIVDTKDDRIVLHPKPDTAKHHGLATSATFFFGSLEEAAGFANGFGMGVLTLSHGRAEGPQKVGDTNAVTTPAQKPDKPRKIVRRSAKR